MRVLITGGCGFVGRRFAARFLDTGYLVTLVDDFSSKDAAPPSVWKNSYRLYEEDFRSWKNNYRLDDFDLILHCAAVVGGRLKIDGDPLAVATDLAIDSDFFNWAIKAKNNPKVIYFSSSAVYPIELQRREWHQPLSESMVHFKGPRIGMPDMSYGWSKLTGEYLAQFAAKTYGLDVVIYRPFSGYGEDQSFDYPFPSIIRRSVNGENPIVIWGSGEQLRDFIYIEDVIDAVLTTKDKLQPGEVLNLGSGQGTSFKQLAKAAHFILKGDRLDNVVNDLTKPEGVFARVADISKLKQWYTPTTSLEQGIQKVAAHMELLTGQKG